MAVTCRTKGPTTSPTRCSPSPALPPTRTTALPSAKTRRPRNSGSSARRPAASVASTGPSCPQHSSSQVLASPSISVATTKILQEADQGCWQAHPDLGLRDIRPRRRLAARCQLPSPITLLVPRRHPHACHVLGNAARRVRWRDAAYVNLDRVNLIIEGYSSHAAFGNVATPLTCSFVTA